MVSESRTSNIRLFVRKQGPIIEGDFDRKRGLRTSHRQMRRFESVDSGTKPEIGCFEIRSPL